MSKQKLGTLIKTARYIKSAGIFSQCPETGLPEYAFIGRSNVGKSSLINMLTGHKGLAKTSSRPGKTQTLNYYLINEKWHMVDLPGYGWAKVSKEKKMKWSVLVNEYLTRRDNLTNLFVLLDARLEPQAIDIEFINWAGDKKIPLSLLFTKADKISNNDIIKNQVLFRKTLLEYWKDLPPTFLTSAKDHRGKEEILKYIESINKNIL